MRRDQQVSTGRSGEPQERIASLKRQSVYQWLSRLGYAARGTVYLVIGWLALSLALGWGGKFADSKEAIRYLATMTAGDVILSTLLIGLVAFSAWRLFQTAFDPDNHGLAPKGMVILAGLLISGLIYLSLALFVARFQWDLPLPLHAGDKSYAEWAALLLNKPAGPWLIAGVSCIALASAVGHFFKAVRKTFLRYMVLDDRQVGWVTLISRIGLLARGSILLLISWYFARVFVSLNPRHALDQAGVLKVLHDQPYGVQLLFVAAVGLMAFGTYGLLEAVFRRIDADALP